MSYTTLLGLAIPSTGTLDGTWGDTVNDSITQLVEDAIAETATADVTSSNWTLSAGVPGGANQERCAILKPTGTPGTSRDIVGPGISKAYVVLNESDGAVVVKASATTGTTIAAGVAALVAWDGSDYVTVASNKIISLTADVSGVLPEANGGTSGLLTVAYGGTGVNTLTGLAKGSGTSAFTAATAGTDYVAPGTATTFVARQSFEGTPGTNLAANFVNGTEKITVAGSTATGTINYDVTTQSVLYYTSNASANWTVNFRGDSGVSLDTLMSTGEALTVAFLVTQGTPAYYNNVVQIDGTPVTPKWQGGTAPTNGNAASIDSYVYTIVKTGAAAFTVFAALTQFA